MALGKTPPLTKKGSKEVLRELNNPPVDNAERRGTFERAAESRSFVEEVVARTAGQPK